MIALVVLLMWVLVSVSIAGFWAAAARRVPTCAPAPVRLPETRVLNAR